MILNSIYLFEFFVPLKKIEIVRLHLNNVKTPAEVNNSFNMSLSIALVCTVNDKQTHRILMIDKR